MKTNTGRRPFLMAAGMLLALGCLSLWNDCVEGKGKPGGGGGGEALINPAIVYVVDDAVITIATADGQTTQKLTGGSKGGSILRRSPVWSPDGSMIAFWEYVGSGMYDLYVMDADGSNLTLAYTIDIGDGDQRYSGIDWLPGGYIHYTGATGPEILDLVDGSIQSLGLDLFHDWVGMSSFSPGIDPTTPGSQGLIVYEALTVGVADGIHLAVVTVDVDGSLLVDPDTIAYFDRPGRQGFPAISPDELQIAFYDDARSDGGDTLAVVDVDYSGPIAFGTVHTLLQAGQSEFIARPTWSPDSQWIAFTWTANINPNRRDPYEIARVRPDGTDFTNMTNSSSHELYVDWNLVWDPSGP